MKPVKSFQSYLIVSQDSDAKKHEADLIKTLGLDMPPTSPDYYQISPQKNSIPIDTIRNLKGHIFQKPLRGNFKLVSIFQAEKLTREAQNAMLKILEEPPMHAIIILFAKNKQTLLPTILSRVTKFEFLKKDKEEIHASSFKSSLLENLNAIGEIENSTSWLDSQIANLYQNLQIAAKQKDTESLKKTAILIEEFSKTKSAILQNVNPLFSLVGLFLKISK